jgi:hypothetical protein
VDPRGEHDRSVWASERVYRALMRLYPEEVRRRYAEEMVRYFGDLCREEWHSRGAKGMVLLWARTLPDLLFSVLKERGTMLLMSAHPPRTPLILLGFAVIFGVISLYQPPRYMAQTRVTVNLKPPSESLRLHEFEELANYGHIIKALDLQMEPDELRRNFSYVGTTTLVGTTTRGRIKDPKAREVLFNYRANDRREAKMIVRKAASVIASHVAKNRRKVTIHRTPATAVLCPQ